jgi:hypothetical protein
VPDTRTKRARIVLAVLAAACSPAPDAGPGSGRPAVGLTAPAALAHPSDDRHPTADVDRNDPAAVAERLVIDTLTEQGLVVTIAATELIEHDPDAATVQVSVVHHPGQGHPHQSLYAIDLERTGGRWRSVGLRDTAR